MEEKLTKKERRELKKEENKKNENAKINKVRIRKIFTWIISAFVLSFISFKVWNYFKTPTPQVAGEKIEVTDGDWTTGPQDAKVVLVEYSDFQCPACAFYRGYVDKLSEEFKDDLRIVYRHFPLVSLHKNATLAAKASEAAGIQGKFWEMHDILFDKQKDWSNDTNFKDILKGYAKDLGLKEDQFMKDLDSEEVAKKVEEDVNSGNSFRINSTPTFFINGNKIQNIRSYDDFKAEIQKYLP